jgi:hypothetical protein
MPLERIQGDAAAVVSRAYCERYGSPVVERVACAYGKSHRILPWATARERTRAMLERVVFVLKWMVPILLIGSGCLLAREAAR